MTFSVNIQRFVYVLNQGHTIGGVPIQVRLMFIILSNRLREYH